jgi:hypothetical protein
MNYSKKLNAIRVILGLQVKLASEKLADGKTVVEAEEFVVGADLAVVAEDGSKSPAPAGEHVTESGKKIVVDEAGKIVSIEEVELESEDPKVEIEVEKAAEPVKKGEEPVKMAEDAPMEESPMKEKMEEKIEEKISEVMKKVMMAMEPIVKDMAEIKAKVAKMEEAYAKFSKAPAAGKIPTLSESQKFGSNNQIDIVDRFNELKNSFKK